VTSLVHCVFRVFVIVDAELLVMLKLATPVCNVTAALLVMLKLPTPVCNVTTA
jgi:hypothetical protein